MLVVLSCDECYTHHECLVPGVVVRRTSGDTTMVTVPGLFSAIITAGN